MSWKKSLPLTTLVLLIILTGCGLGGASAAGNGAAGAALTGRTGQSESAPLKINTKSEAGRQEIDQKLNQNLQSLDKELNSLDKSMGKIE